MADHSGAKLGRTAIKTDARTLQMGNYLTAKLPAPPPKVDWTNGVTGWGMMMNDQLGNCTIAGAGHAVQVWTVNRGGIATIPDSVIEKAYQDWGGYKPDDPTTDTGGATLDVLNGWKNQGFGGHALAAFVDPVFADLTEIRQSIALFGGVYVGFAMPQTAMTQDVWDVVQGAGGLADKGGWGGHCVYVPQYDETGFTCITWGQLKRITVAFWNAYCDEAHTLLGQDWLDEKNTPEGFDHDQLMADLQAIR